MPWCTSCPARENTVLCAPGNPGIARQARCVAVDAGDPAALLDAGHSRRRRSHRHRSRTAAEPGRGGPLRGGGPADRGSHPGGRRPRIEQGLREGLHGAAPGADRPLPGVHVRGRGTGRGRERRTRSSPRRQGRRTGGGQGRGHCRRPGDGAGHDRRRDGHAPVRLGRRPRGARGVSRGTGGVVLRAVRRHVVRHARRPRRITSASSTAIVDRTPAAWVRSRRVRSSRRP